MRPLAVLLLLPAMVRAQDRCVPDAVWRLPPTHVVLPNVVQWSRGALVMLGSPGVLLERSAAGRMTVVDTMAAGLRASLDGMALAPIPHPPGSPKVVFPRAFESNGISMLLWGARADTAGPDADLQTHTLRVGRFDGSAWHDVRTIGDFVMRTSFSPQRASDVIALNGIHYFAAVVEDERPPFSRMAVVSDSGGIWRTHVFELATRGLAGLALAAHEGQLVVAFLGIPLRLPDGVSSAGATLYVSRLVGNRWSDPVQVGGDRTATTLNPKLVAAPDGLLAAWSTLTEARAALEWRRVSFDGPHGAVQRLEGAGFVSQGQLALRHLLAVATTDGRAKVIRPRRDGFDLIDDTVLEGGVPPTIGGSLARPVAVYTVVDDSAGAAGAQVEIRDLRCGLRRAEQGSTR